MEQSWSLYIIATARSNRLYTGITLDVARRFQEHRAGAMSSGISATAKSRKGAKALRGQGEIQLLFNEAVGDRSTALRLEYRVKQLSRKDKERLVQGELLLQELLPVD